MLSRSAENFYWMGRYIERVNTLSRLLLIQLREISEDSPDLITSSWKEIFSGLNIEYKEGSLFENSAQSSDDFVLANAYTLFDYLTFETHHSGSLLSYLHRIRQNALENQDKISDLIWPHINKKYLQVKDMHLQDIWPDKALDFYKEFIEFTSLFYALVEDNLYQNLTYHFINLGRYTERLQNATNIFENHLRILWTTEKQEQDDLISLFLRCGAYSRYKQIHSLDLDFRKGIDFLIYDTRFSNSIQFSYNQIKKNILSIEQECESQLLANKSKASQFDPKQSLANLAICKRLEKINKHLKQGYAGEPLIDFLSTILEQSFLLHQDTNSTYFNPYDLSVLSKK